MLERYGWKTILGTILLTVGQLVPVVPVAAPLIPFAPLIIAAGTALGGVGIAHKLVKLGSK